MHQIDGHCLPCQLCIQVQKFFPDTIGAQKIIAAAIRQAAHGRARKTPGTGHGLHKGAISSGGKNAQLLPSLGGLLGCLLGRCPGMACILCAKDGKLRRVQSGPGSCGLDLGAQGGSAILLTRSRVQQKKGGHPVLLIDPK